MNFRKANLLFAWITCAIATIVYLITAEPTVSFWDCGEFLSCAAKLEVAHSPGAPLFMLIQRAAALLAFGNKEKVALLINSWSAIAAGLTILFLFWTITHFAKRIIVPATEEPDRNSTIQIIACGIVGSLAYTFSDTFWYSAVEAEVYATSSLFTAIVFWAILKWDQQAADRHADKWLLFIAYMIGLSVGIHLLNLLAIPAITMVYYYRRYTPSVKGTIIALAAGAGILVFVQIGILQGLPMMAKGFQLFFVNNLHMPFNTGVWVYIVLLVAVLTSLLFYAKRRQHYVLHIATLAVLFIAIGFSSYFVPILRSRADVPVDMVNPDNAVNLVSYIKREHYTQQPLMYGPDFTSIRTGWKQTDAEYAATKNGGKDNYTILGYRKEPEFQEGTQRLFPRMWDVKNRQQINFYRSFLGIADNDLATSDDNMKFFFKYQMGWMWWRYLMWNYAGRQNDMEGQGDPKNGNWASGIGFIDNMRGLGDMDKMSDGYRNNAARNELYMLPFILGIIGLVYQIMRSKKDALIIGVFFFYTGIALAIYLNMGPMQSRERDYAFAGCTYAFAVWIGLGVLLVTSWVQKIIKHNNAAYIAAAVCLIAVPIVMARAEWNDHNRSGKTLARAAAWNTLQSCEPNAVLFTFGDNYTYPLWYMQEVEEVRRDVRVINLGLLEGHWYIDQLNYKINDADAVPMIWTRGTYTQPSAASFVYSQNPQIPGTRYFDLTEICRFMADDKNVQETDDGPVRYFPAKNYFVPSLSKAALVQRNMLNVQDTSGVNNVMQFTCPLNRLSRANVAMYNVIAAIAKEGWNRPVYFGDGITNEDMAGMQDYARLEGCVYHLLPYKYNTDKVQDGAVGTVDANKSYELLTGKYIWGGAERKDVYFDAKNRLALTTYRVNAGRVAEALINKGEKQKAITLLDHVSKMISEHSYFYDGTMYYIAMAYYQAGANDKASAIALKIARNGADDVRYIQSLNDEGMDALAPEMNNDLAMMKALGKVAVAHNDMNTANALMQQFQSVSKGAEN